MADLDPCELGQCTHARCLDGPDFIRDCDECGGTGRAYGVECQTCDGDGLVVS